MNSAFLLLSVTLVLLVLALCVVIVFSVQQYFGVKSIKAQLQTLLHQMNLLFHQQAQIGEMKSVDEGLGAAQVSPPSQGTPVSYPPLQSELISHPTLQGAPVSFPLQGVTASFAPPQGTPVSCPLQGVTASFLPPQGAPVSYPLQEVAASFPPPQGAPTPLQTPARTTWTTSTPAPTPLQTPARTPTPTPGVYSTTPPMPLSAKTTAPRSMENILGKNVIGFVAAALVFIGIIFLGFLVVPSFTDTIKIALMFILGGTLGVAGYLLNRRYKNYFTLALLGCGCGALFIAIQVAHLYFAALNDILAYALILVWAAAALYIERQTQSLVVSIIAHMGMVFSLCSGFAFGLTDDKLLLLLGYQLISSVIIIVGNILCCMKMYRPGIFISLFFTVYASFFMWTAFYSPGVSFASSIPAPLITMSFIAQFLASSFLAYLLFVSITRVNNTAARVSMQIFNLVLWLVALVLNVTLLVGKLTVMLGLASTSSAPLLNFDTVPLAYGISLLIMFTVLFSVILLRKKVQFAPEMSTVTSITIIAASCYLLAYQAYIHFLDISSVQAFVIVWYDQFGPPLFYLAIPALVSIFAHRLTKKLVYAIIGLILICSDSLFMVSWGYSWLVDFISSPWLALLYLIIVLAMMTLLYSGFESRERKRLQTALTITMVIYFEVSLFFILLSYNTYLFKLGQLLSAIGFTTALALLVVLHFAKQDKPGHFFLVNNSLVILLLALVIEGNIGLAKNMATQGNIFTILTVILLMVAALLALLLIFERLRAAARDTAAAERDPLLPEKQAHIEIITVITLSLLLLAVVRFISSNDDLSFALSLIWMVISLLVVVIGFWLRTKSIRLYGLIVIMLCVLKLVLFDVGELDTAMRVIAFIGGGAICFGISALYNFAVKRYDRERIGKADYQ